MQGKELKSVTWMDYWGYCYEQWEYTVTSGKHTDFQNCWLKEDAESFIHVSHSRLVEVCGVLMSLPYSNSIFAGDFLHNDKLMIARNVTLVLHLRKTHKASVFFFWWGRGGAYVLYLIWWWSNGYTHL